MDIEYLKRFVLVSQTLNFRKASDTLFISQPTLSHSISALEKEIGVPLFERNTKTVKLTPAGEKFMQACMQMLKIYEGVTTELAMNAAKSSNILHIGYTGPALGRGLSPLVTEFKAANPDVDIRLSRYHGTEVRDALDNKEIQLAIVFEEYGTNIPNSQFTKVSSEKFKLVVNKDSKYIGLDHMSLKDIVSEPLLICQRDMSPFYYDKVLDLFAYSGLNVHIGQEVRRISDIYRLVDMGLGYAIMSLSDTSFYDNFNLKFIDIDGIPEDMLYHNRIMVWKGNLSPAAAKFREIVSRSKVK